MVDPQGRQPAEVTAWITSADGRWDARGEFRVEGGQVICTRLNVGSAPPGITSGFLRTVPMGTILTLVRSAIAEQADLFEAAARAVGPDSDFGQGTRAAAAHLRPEKKRRGDLANTLTATTSASLTPTWLCKRRAGAEGCSTR